MLLNQTFDKLDALGLFGMAMGLREQLEATQYANLSFEERLGLLVDGPPGGGKSFLACALTRAAVRRGHTALYVRTPRLLTELALSRGDGRYVRRLGQLARIGLLVLDDFLLTPPSVIEAKDLLEVIDDRSQVRSTLVVSQLPVEAWHPALAGGDPTLADAILDRLVQHAHRLPLTGASMRRRQPPPETDG